MYLSLLKWKRANNDNKRDNGNHHQQHAQPSQPQGSLLSSSMLSFCERPFCEITRALHVRIQSAGLHRARFTGNVSFQRNSIIDRSQKADSSRLLPPPPGRKSYIPQKARITILLPIPARYFAPRKTKVSLIGDRAIAVNLRGKRGKETSRRNKTETRDRCEIARWSKHTICECRRHFTPRKVHPGMSLQCNRWYSFRNEHSCSCRTDRFHAGGE